MAYDYNSDSNVTPMMALVGASSPSRDGSAQNSLYPGSQDIFGNLSTAVDARMDNPSTQSPFFDLLPSQSKDAMTGGYGSVPAPAPTTAAPGSNTQNWLLNFAKNMPAGGDADRASGEALMKSAGDRLNSAASAPAPVYNRPKLSPLEALGLALAAGAGNSASPYTSEGSKFFDSFTGSREQQAQQDYQQAQAQRQQQMQAAQTGYKVAGDQAAPLYASADDADKNLQNAKDRLAAAGLNGAQVEDAHAHEAATFAAGNSEADRRALQTHQFNLEEMDKSLSGQVKIAILNGQIRNQSDLQNFLTQSVMNNPLARQAGTTDMFIHGGFSPSEAQAHSEAMKNLTPAEQNQITQNSLGVSNAKIAKSDADFEPRFNQLKLATQQSIIDRNAGDTAMQKLQLDNFNKLTPSQQLDYVTKQSNQSKADYINAVARQAQYASKWQTTHPAGAGFLTGDKAPDMTKDPEYIALQSAVQTAGHDWNAFRHAGNTLSNIKIPLQANGYGATPGSPSPAVPGAIVDSGVTSSNNTYTIPKIPK